MTAQDRVKKQTFSSLLLLQKDPVFASQEESFQTKTISAAEKVSA